MIWVQYQYRPMITKQDGRMVWEFSRMVDGKRVRRTKLLPRGWTKQQADDFDRAETARVYAKATGASLVDNTIDDAVQLYIKHRLPELATGENVKRELELIEWAYKGKSLGELHAVCRTYASEAKAVKGGKLSPASIRNRIRYLTAACRYAWKHHDMGEMDPASRVTVPVVDNGRHVYMSRRQMLEICRKCNHRVGRMAIRVAFYSGMRLGEICRATVDGDCWVLVTSKNKQPRRIPIHRKTLVCARRLPDQMSKRAVQNAFKRSRTASKLSEVHFHDLRHSTASALINEGVDLFVVGAVLGHLDPRSTQRYSHLKTDTLAAAIAKIG